MNRFAVSMPHCQCGAVFLLFLLVLLAGTSALMLRGLDLFTLRTVRTSESAQALAVAKAGLLHFAALYPDNGDHEPEAGPGYLPCPDTKNDGSADGSCEENELGRLPWTTLDLPDLRDGTGERLWYVVSPAFRGIANKQLLNSETRAQLSLDGADDIVAVVIAPGAPLPAQQRLNDVDRMNGQNYVEGTNNDGNASFANFAAGDITGNDRIIGITRRELVQVMEQRVLNEMRRRIERFAENIKALSIPSVERYPLLGRMRDQRAAVLSWKGQASAGSSDRTVLQTVVSFVSLGITPGAIVYNKRDGSFGTAVTVSSGQIDVDGWLGGTGNLVAPGDELEIWGIPLAQGKVMAEETGPKSPGFKADKMLGELELHRGDVVEKLGPSPRPHGLLRELDKGNKDKVYLTDVLPANGQRFDVNDDYRVRTQGGRVSQDAVGELVDDLPPIAFDNSAARPLLVKNLERNTFAFVSTSVAATSKRLPLVNGEFLSGDPYLLSPFMDVPTQAAGEGWLPIHRIGEPFPTGLRIQWTTDNLSFTPAPSSALPSALQTVAWQKFLKGSAFVVSAADDARTSMCTWTASNIADCSMILKVAGKVFSGSGLIMQDPDQDYQRSGLAQGDLLLLKSPTGTVTARGIIKSDLDHQVEVYGLEGGGALTAGSDYQIRIATQEIAGTAGSASAGTRLTLDPVTVARLVSNPTLNDMVVLVGAPGTEVPAVMSRQIDQQTLELDWLGLPPPAAFGSGTPYRLRWNFLDYRQLNVRIQGSAQLSVKDGRRVRTVSLLRQPPQTVPVFTLHDFDVNGKDLGGTTAMDAGILSSLDIQVQDIHMHLAPVSGVAAAGTASNTLKDPSTNFSTWGVAPGDHVLVSVRVITGAGAPATKNEWGRVTSVNGSTLTLQGLQVHVNDSYRVYADFPPWLVSRDWQRLLYLAERADYRPGATTTTGNLQVTGRTPEGNQKFVLLAAGDSLPLTPLTGQDRGVLGLSQFFEDNNQTQYDDQYAALPQGQSFNDRLIAVPGP